MKGIQDGDESRGDIRDRVRYPKLHRCLVFAHSEDERFALLPVGLCCNGSISKAKSGERIEFRDDMGKTVSVIKRVCRLPVNSPLFTFMCHSIYGHGSFERLAEKWTVPSLRAGLGGRVAFSWREVLLVELSEWDKEAYIAGERFRQERETALHAAVERERAAKEKAEERERLIASISQQIENGQFAHPDVL